MVVKRAITVGRISSVRQEIMGNSLSDQEKQIQIAIRHIEKRHQCNIKIIKEFEFVHSASVELEFQPLLKAIDFAKNPKNKIDYIFIKSIDRATRAGAIYYGLMKQSLIDANVALVDVYGVINYEMVNTLAHHDIEFPWSKYNPSWITELLEAERAKSEVRDNLTRMIGAEISYVRAGYWVGQANFGYQNVKIDTSKGKRTIIVTYEPEAKFILRIFQLREQGNLSDLQICQKINRMGFRTRTYKMRDKSKQKVIALKGNKKLTQKGLQRYIQNPIYCGVHNHKWLKGYVLKQSFQGIVSIKMWNAANMGKRRIESIKGGYKLVIGRSAKNKIRDHDNPLFPFKNYVLCPICKWKLYGSSSRGRSGVYYPRYHCGKIHKYWGVSKPKFDETIRSFIKKVKIKDKYKQDLKKSLPEMYQAKVQEYNVDHESVKNRLKQIEAEQDMLAEKIKLTSSLVVIQKFEAEIDELEAEKKSSLKSLNGKVKDDRSDDEIHAYMNYFLDHLDELVLDEKRPFVGSNFFGTLFEVLPTYDELVSGDVKLSKMWEVKG